MALPNLESVSPAESQPPEPTTTPSRLQQSETLLQRTISDSDISYELTTTTNLEPIPEAEAAVEDAKCECCGMCEECTPEYVDRIKESFSGKLVCGLCAEAVKEETDKNGGQREKALEEHVQACIRFNSIGTNYPLLYQAEAVKEILKKTKRSSFFMNHNRGVGIERSSSCIPAIGKGTGGTEAFNDGGLITALTETVNNMKAGVN